MFGRTVSLCIVTCALLAQAIESNFGTAAISQVPSAAVAGGQAGAAAPVVTRSLPFRPGEVLTYNVAFSKLFLSGSIGQLKLTVTNKQTDASKDSATGLVSSTGKEKTGPDNAEQSARSQTRMIVGTATPAAPTDQPPSIEFGARVMSKGFFTWLFGIKVEDSYGAVVRSDDFGLLRSWKEIDQGDLHRHYETRVDRDLGTVSYQESDRNKPGPANVKTAKSPRWILDLLSAVYFIRTQEFKEGTPITIPLTDVGQIYSIDVVPVKREEVDVEAGKYKSVQLDLKIFDGKYIKRSGQLLVWLTDDGKRLPVRARLKSSGATVNITLLRSE